MPEVEKERGKKKMVNDNGYRIVCLFKMMSLF